MLYVRPRQIKIHYETSQVYVYEDCSEMDEMRSRKEVVNEYVY